MPANARSSVFQAGMEEGRMQVRKAVMDYLENVLVTDKEVRPDRDSPEYAWAMQFTRDLGKHISSVVLK